MNKSLRLRNSGNFLLVARECNSRFTLAMAQHHCPFTILHVSTCPASRYASLVPYTVYDCRAMTLFIQPEIQKCSQYESAETPCVTDFKLIRDLQSNGVNLASYFEYGTLDCLTVHAVIKSKHPYNMDCKRSWSNSYSDQSCTKHAMEEILMSYAPPEQVHAHTDGNSCHMSQRTHAWENLCGRLLSQGSGDSSWIWLY